MSNAKFQRVTIWQSPEPLKYTGDFKELEALQSYPQGLGGGSEFDGQVGLAPHHRLLSPPGIVIALATIVPPPERLQVVDIVRSPARSGEDMVDFPA